ncbi:MAG TPA: ArsA-related P-loop ATPase [Candidatus Saccharimonadales bacterium]|nr:ArsA-related P-loop ATPase [Candidatus Saccharimonadales bacterium]
MSTGARVPERRRGPREKPGDLGARLASLEVVVCCGSGGVGKTTVSAALGMAVAAAEDKRVLVLTVDPARRLATALGISGIGADPVRVPKPRLKRAGMTLRGDLEAAMLDMKQEWDRMIERYSPDRATAQRILRNPLYQRITDSFVGSHEYAAIEALFELHEAGEYDCIVVDTPPSRSALDFLEAPTRLTDFVGSRLLSLLSGSSSRLGFRAMNFAATPFLRLADRLLGAEVLKEVSEFVQQLQLLYGGIQDRARSVSKLLRSPETGFVVVTTLEHGPFAEAEFFCTKLREFKMPLRAIVVNRVLPDTFRDAGAVAAATTLAEDPKVATWLSSELHTRIAADTARFTGETFLRRNRLSEREARQLLRLNRIGDVPVVRVPLFSEEVSELEGLVRIARVL